MSATLTPTGARLLLGVGPGLGPVVLAEHLRLHGPLPHRPDLVDEVDAAGLRGMGGAGFPVARKLRAVAGARAPVVVVNATEGEPASAKDRALLSRAPHLVLDGATAAARAIGATRVVVAVGEGAPEARDAAILAVAERRARGLTVTVTETPARFVAGEDSALVRFLSGGPALPTTKPPRPDQRGVDGRPTLVQNAETLAHLALVARHGAGWFRAAGTPDEPGTALVTLTGAVREPGVVEVALGTPLEEVLGRAGGPSRPLRALLAGGYHGGFVPADALGDLVLTDRSLRGAGAGLGARALVAVPEDACGLAEAVRIADYLARESAGQCGPCTLGLRDIADALRRLHAGARSEEARIARWLGLVAGRGACRHPDGAARLVASALATFAPEIAAHAGAGCHVAPPTGSRR
jgi:NADH:ubiquinone oxidoreductase subunit F (NADH-binding)